MAVFLKVCIPLLFMLGPSLILGACTDNVKGATWIFNPVHDIEIPYVQSVDECRQYCLSDHQYCRGYTYTTNGVVGSCYKFNELNEIHECSTCISGITPEFIEGSCQPEHAIEEEITESAETCVQKCLNTPGCNSFTWHDSSSRFQHICSLFSKCDSVLPCSGCQSGKVSCIQNPHCFDYWVLDEELRNVNIFDPHDEEIMKFSDTLDTPSWTSPRWKGSGYYRMMSPAGLYIPEYDPGYERCGADVGGYLSEGSHPTEVGVEVDAVIVYSGQTACTKAIKITKCPGNYYVYFLPGSCYVASRYCASFIMN